jgi:hypothetical protein
MKERGLLTSVSDLTIITPVSGRSSVVERVLPKHDIVGSSPIARS